MNEKPSFLSRKDYEKAEKLLKKISGKKPEKEELIHFLKYLEKNYEIKDFGMDDFRGVVAIDDELHERYDSIKSHHATHPYTNLLMCLINEYNDETASIYSKKFEKFALHQINRIEREMKDSNVSSDLAVRVLSYLDLLVWGYKSINNMKGLIKTYNKFIHFISDMGSPRSPFLSDVKEFIEKESLPSKLLFHINDISELYQSGIQIFGNDPALIKCIIKALNFADDDEPCLILGETGTGKELIAKIIHNFSRRKDNRFWAVNCGGFTDSLFNSEISGIHWRAASDIGTRLGAFLTACSDGNDNGYYIYRRNNRDRGEIRFKLNNSDIEEPTEEDLLQVGGTLFLDEINSLPEHLQSKLLRIIQENEVQVVGEDRVRKFHIKLICASNTDLTGNKEDKGFRNDLYYRISRGIVRLPSLREMKESIIEIADFKISEICEKLNYEKDIKITARAKKKLQNYDWPGNIRELENVLYRALKDVIMDESSELKYNYIEELENREQITNQYSNPYLNMTYDDVERKYMGFLLEEANGNIAEVMRFGGFKSRSPVYRILKKHGLYNKLK